MRLQTNSNDKLFH